MFTFSSMFSEDYSNHLEHRDKIKSLVIRAKEELKGGTLYGVPINTSNPEDLIACLYIMYKDYDQFHERL